MSILTPSSGRASGSDGSVKEKLVPGRAMRWMLVVAWFLDAVARGEGSGWCLSMRDWVEVEERRVEERMVRRWVRAWTGGG
jgi:hypothetical protein